MPDRQLEMELIRKLHLDNTARLDNIDRQLTEQNHRLIELTETINQARGGLKMLIVLGSVAASLAAIWNVIWHFARNQP